MDNLTDRFKVATVRANVHGAVRNWFLAHPEWANGTAGSFEDLLGQLEQEFTTKKSAHDTATELHTTFQAAGESPVDFANRVRALVVALQPEPLADSQGLLTLKYCCTSDALRMKLQAESSYSAAHRTCSLLLGQEFVGKGGSYLQARHQAFYATNHYLQPRIEPSVSDQATPASSGPKRAFNKRTAEPTPQERNKRVHKTFLPQTAGVEACPRCRQQHALAQCTAVRCNICGRLGHQAEKCYSASGRPKQVSILPTSFGPCDEFELTNASFSNKPNRGVVVEKEEESDI
ncbi:hypothetical protein V1519DRAFT_501141 [Lipomyces tetrasporus]